MSLPVVFAAVDGSRLDSTPGSAALRRQGQWSSIEAVRVGSKADSASAAFSWVSEEIAARTRRDLSQNMDTIARILQGLIRERRDDWSQRREEQAAQRTESDQRFNNMLEDARADHQRMAEQTAANEVEHRAFREKIQVLLAEIARIWQRLQAG